MLKDILLISIGSISAIISGFLSMWYQAKKARKLRFEELVGEKMVDVCGKALPLILEVRKRLLGDSTEKALRYIEEKTSWVNESRAFLPDQFYNTWHSIYRNARRRTDPGKPFSYYRKGYYVATNYD